MSNPVEEIKEKSRQLRGTIVPTLLDPTKDHFSEEDYQLLKFHGTYQQDDRDLRVERKKQGLDKAWMFMIRTKTPGGALTAAQYLTLDNIAENLANGTLRITNRQGIQFHGVLKKSMQAVMQQVYQSGMTTWGACGDVVRNTMASPEPLYDRTHEDVQKFAAQLSDTFLAKATSYVKIWLTSPEGEKIELTADETEIVEEPIYGKHYLPRKFKIGIVIPPRNDVDIYTQDLGFVAHTAPDGRIEGYTVLVGGGFGMSHGQTHTYPVLSKPLGFIPAEQALDVAVAVVTTQRDHGFRHDRKQARLKYLIEQRGLDWFRSEVRSRLKNPELLREPRSFSFEDVSDRLGWHEQGDGRLWVCVPVEVGRIKDIAAPGPEYRTAFRRIAQEIGCPIRLTPNCNIIFHDILPSQRQALEAILAQHRVVSGADFTRARKVSHACVALPTCGLALAESERVFPEVMDEIDAILRDLQLDQEPLLIRMSGCPNGCPRPYNADLAFVGRAPGKYAFYVGGSYRGDRLAGLALKTLKIEDIPSTVRDYLLQFKAGRNPGETFTDWWGRTHTNGEPPSSEQFHVELAERAARLQGQKASPPDGD